MKLQDDLPHGVTVNGKTYRMNFDFRRVLKMMEYLDRNDLFPGAREHLALSCVMRRPRADKASILPAVME
jgi:hypothetical protein